MFTRIHGNRLVYWALLTIIVLFIPAGATAADPPPPPELPLWINSGEPGDRNTPPMAYRPPTDANDLTDFLSADSTFTTAPLQPITASSVLTITKPITQLVSFGAGDVALLMESETFATAVTLTFKQSKAAMPAVGESWPERLLFFQLEAQDAHTREPIARFDKNVRLVVDLRSFGLDVTTLGDGAYFLAYRDPEQPSIWHDVPVWTHQADGLISAEVNHFSDWTAGWRPEVWKPEWNPPAVSEFSGAATYSYAVTVPPGRRGLQPTVSLSYNSRGLDGAIHSVGGDTLASGWSMSDIYVAREGVEIDFEQDNYRLIHPDRFRLVLNGQGHELTAEGATTDDVVRYYAKDAPGLRVYRYYDDDVNAVPNTEGIYWIVQTADGTQYRLGYIADAEEWHQLVAQGSIEISGHRGRDATGEQQQTSAMGWHVDTVTDMYGNQIVYNYNNEVGTKYACERGDFCSFALEHHHHKVRIASIAYNFPGRAPLNSNGSIPNHVDRLSDPPHLQTPATLLAFHARGYVDIWGNWNENLMGPIQNILIYHGGNVNTANPIREYRLESENRTIDPNVADCPGRDDAYPQGSVTRVLLQIREWANTDRNPHDSTDGYGLPPLQFTYTALPHYYKSGDSNRPCFSFSYLESASNGYGGVVRFTYESDGRSIGNYIRHNFHQIEWPNHGFNYVVTAVTHQDGRVENGDELSWRTEYAYHRPCYAQWGDNVGSYHTPTKCHAPGVGEYGNIAGFLRTTVTYKGYENETLNARQTEFALINDNLGQLPEMGRPLIQDSLGADGVTVLHRATYTYATTPIHNNIGSFTYTQETRSYQYHNGSDSAALSSKTSYEYAPVNQGGAQYGNLTHTREYSDADSATPYRTTVRWYFPNVNTWLVGPPAAEAVYAGNNSAVTLLNGVWYYYDDAPTNIDPPTQGKLTRSRTFQPAFNTGAPPYTYQTIDTTFRYSEYGNQESITTYNTYGSRTLDSNGEQVANQFPLAADGRTTNITYETAYNLYPIATSNPLDQTTTFQIYGFNEVPAHQFNNNLYIYTIPAGSLKQVTGVDGVTVKYEYDPFGRLLAVYDGDTRYNGVPFAGFLGSDAGDGDPVARYGYWDNRWNNAVTFLDPAAGAPFVITTEQRPGSYAGPSTDSSEVAFNDQTFYDGFGRPIQTRSLWNWLDDADQSREIISMTAYNALGNVSCQTVPFDIPYYDDQPKTWPASPFYTTETCVDRPHTTTTYDALGRPLLVTAPDETTTTYSYFVIDTITVDGRNTLALTNIKDANNHIIGRMTNSLGQLAMVQEIAGTGQPGYTSYSRTRYYYDLMGNLTEVRTTDGTVNGDPNPTGPETLRRVLMEYDNLGRKTGMDDPDMGEWTYRYDAAGNLREQFDANGLASGGASGSRLCFWYDGLNRLTHKAKHAGTCPAAPITSGDNWLASYIYDDELYGIGKLGRVDWASNGKQFHETFSYDHLGRLAQHTRVLDGKEYEMGYADFDPLQRPQIYIYPNGEEVRIQYDREGENSLTVNGAGLVQDVRYNARGQIMAFDRNYAPNTKYKYYPATGSNGNNNFRLEVIQHGAINDDLPSFTYTYDPVGNVKSIEERIQNDAAMQNFDYDHLDRLDIACTWTGSACHDTPNLSAGQYNHNYNYDVLGNISQRIEKDGDATTTYTYNYGAKPHAVTAVTGGSQPQNFTYDPNGNMETRQDVSGNFAQEFDVENRLVRVTKNGNETTSFYYDTNGLRIMSQSPDNVTTYIPFPNYEETPAVSAAEAVDVSLSVPNNSGFALATHDESSWPLTTPDENGLALATGDHPGWSLSMSGSSSWAANLQPLTAHPWEALADPAFPATSRYIGEGVGAPRGSDSSVPLAFNNLASGALQSTPLPLVGGRPYRLRVWINAHGTVGSAAIHIGTGQNFIPLQKIWEKSFPLISPDNWMQVDVEFTAPITKDDDLRLQLIGEQIHGWVAFDELTIHEQIKGVFTLRYQTGFETDTEWISLPDLDFPATSIWHGGSGPATPYSGSYSYAFSNLGYSELTSPQVILPSMPFNGEISIHFWWQNGLSAVSAGGMELFLLYQIPGAPLQERLVWQESQTPDNHLWQSVSLTDQPPANATSVELRFRCAYCSGWTAVDDVIVQRGVISLASWDFTTPTWRTTVSGEFPGGAVWHGPATVVTPGDPYVPSLAYIFTNEAQGSATTPIFTAGPQQAFRLDGWLRGHFAGATGGARLVAQFYADDQLVGEELLWNSVALNDDSWKAYSQTVILPGNANRFRLLATAGRLNGWWAVDDATILRLDQVSPWYVNNEWQATVSPQHPATSLANEGIIGAPYVKDDIVGAGRAMPFNNLAHGALRSPELVLTPGRLYHLSAHLAGAISQGQARLELVYELEAGQSSIEPVWGGDLVGGGWVPISASFVAASDGRLRLQLSAADLDGWVALDQVALTYEENDGTIVTVHATGFEDGEDNWAAAPDPNFPATSVWRGGQGPATPHSGAYSYAISNLGDAALSSPWLEIQPGMALKTSLMLGAAGGMINPTAADIDVYPADVRVVARYYDDNKTLLPYQETQDLLWQMTTPLAGWQEISASHTAPERAFFLEIRVESHFFRGELVLDDVTVVNMDQEDILAAWDFNTAQQAVWLPVANPDFPATAVWHGANVGRNDSGGYLFTTAAQGALHSSLFLAEPSRAYHLTAALRGRFHTPSGAARLWVTFYGNAGLIGSETLWQYDANDITTHRWRGYAWQPLQATFSAPPAATHFQIHWEVDSLVGWLALDSVTIANLSDAIPVQPGQLYEVDAQVRGQLAAPGQQAVALAVAYYDANGGEIAYEPVWGTDAYDQSVAQAQGGGFVPPARAASARIALAVSVDNDAADGWVIFNRITFTAVSNPFPLARNRVYDLSARVSGVLNSPTGETAGLLTARLYTSNGNLLHEVPLWESSSYQQPTGQVQSGAFTPGGGLGPEWEEQAAAGRVALTVTLDEGWLAFSDITLSTVSDPIPVVGGRLYELASVISGQMNVAAAGQVALRYNGGSWQTLWQNPAGMTEPEGALVKMPFTPPTGSSSVQVRVQARLDAGWVTYDGLALTTFTEPLTLSAGRLHHVSMMVRGYLHSDQTGARGMLPGTALTVYNSAGNEALASLWQWEGYNAPEGAWQAGTFTAPAVAVRLGLTARLDRGWIGFGDVQLAALTEPIFLVAGQEYLLAAQVAGVVNAPPGQTGVALTVYSADGREAVQQFWSSQTYNTPGGMERKGVMIAGGIGETRLGLTARLDGGWVNMADATLRTRSVPVPVTANTTYTIQGQVLGQAATTPDGQPAARIMAEVCPAQCWYEPIWESGGGGDWNEPVVVTETVTVGNAEAEMRLWLEMRLEYAALALYDVRVAEHYTIRRSTYMLAGQAVAVRVSGDPDGNDGLHYLYSDHLGSASAMQKDDGSAPIITRYLPFGGYHGGSSPNQVTDRGFTGHKHNDDLGLVYMNARFYVSYLNRFLSADTIVPNPANPQSLNRYSYVLNRPLNFSDPTGHMDTPFDSGGGLGTPVSRHYCTESYGCFDREHIEAGALKLNDVIAKIAEAIKMGDSFPIRGGFGPTLGGRGSGFVAYYSVSGTIAPEQIPGVAIGILMDYETRWEELQGRVPFGASYQSSFSIEDLPSDYLGWMLALNSEGGSVGEAMAEAFSLLGGAKAVSNVPHPVRSQPWIHEGSMTPTSVLMPVRNREFTPMVSTESGGWQNVSWPNELQITPIESSANTWQFASSGYCVFGFGDCGNP